MKTEENINGKASAEVYRSVVFSPEGPSPGQSVSYSGSPDPLDRDPSFCLPQSHTHSNSP